MIAPTCGHPDRPAKARGLCKPCWSREQRAGWTKTAPIDPAGLRALVEEAANLQTPVRIFIGTPAGGPLSARTAHWALGVAGGKTACLVKTACDLMADVLNPAEPRPEATAIRLAGREGVDCDLCVAGWAEHLARLGGTHPHVRNQVYCPDCGKPVSKGNVARHRKTRHGTVAA